MVSVPEDIYFAFGMAIREDGTKLGGNVGMIFTVAYHSTRGIFATSPLERRWTVKIWIQTKHANED